MITRLAVLAVLLTAVALPAPAGEETSRRSRMKDILKARIAQDAKEAETKQPAPATSTAKNDQPAPTTAKQPANASARKSPPAKSKKASADESPTMLPKVEVRKDRITELDQKLAKQEQDIARERKNLQISEVDSALNDMKIARPLAIFGGESSQFRKRVASERIELMEAEKDIIEAIAHAKSKEEKDELQKQLDQLKAFRRELDKSLR